MNQMKRGLFLLATICCVLFASCKKDGGGANTGEDLSYLIMTYQRFEAGGQIYKSKWTYDGYKLMGNQNYVDGQLISETKNYSYNGLNTSYDGYVYWHGDTNDVGVAHHECEYLDETFQRPKYIRYYITNSDSGSNDLLYETYREYDGKKLLYSKSYTNGVLTDEIHCNYDGLRCSYKTTDYLGNTIYTVDYEILYLDETYLRVKSNLQTSKRYDTNGNLTSSSTSYFVYDYDGKKRIGYHYYSNGILVAVARDYQYDGLTCYYFVDDYQDGEVVSTRMYEVEYLE